MLIIFTIQVQPLDSDGFFAPLDAPLQRSIHEVAVGMSNRSSSSRCAIMPADRPPLSPIAGSLCIVVGYALNAKKLRESDAASAISCPSSSNYADHRHSSPAAAASKEKSATTMWSGGGLADIVSNSSTMFSRQQNIKFIAFDYSLPPERHPCYDVLIHKLTEDIIAVDSSSGNDNAAASACKLRSIQDYTAYNSKCIIVDPIDSVRIVTSRLSTYRSIDAIRLKHIDGGSALVPLRQPEYLHVPASATIDDIAGDMSERGITFPVICKPESACGHQDSHSMAVILCAQGLHLFLERGKPFLVQKYHDHCGVLCKVYVIGDDVFVCTRRSLPDLKALVAQCGSSAKDGLVFDSRKVYPVLSDFYSPSAHSNITTARSEEAAGPVGDAYGEQIADSHRAVLQSYARQLKRGLGLGLFGFDVIIASAPSVSSSSGSGITPRDGETAMVIDVNFFPSYKEVTDFPDRLCDFLRQRSVL